VFLTDGRFHAVANVGTDKGLAEVTARSADIGAFRTPSLINVAVTAPYMHDGSARTLDAAIAAHHGVEVSSADRSAILAYLNDLTDRRFLRDRRHAHPAKACGRRL
jgi:cytochrome c peroxidase